VRIKLVVDDWQKKGVSIYSTPEGVELTMGSFHAGTTFDGEIKLNPEDEAELKEALDKGYQPVFWVAKE
jgi:hypothetical protein